MSSAEAVSVPPAGDAGSRFLAEIREQPAALTQLLKGQSEFARVAAEMHARGATTVRMVGHGSSDNAASYGVYAFGLLPHWTALRDSISLTVYYGAELDMSGCTAIALSQSGRTPDVVEYARRARRRGAFIVALTNDPESELAEAADAVLPLGAGREQAVAATKTYTNQVAALGLLAAHTAGTGARFADDLRVVTRQLDELIAPRRVADHGRGRALRVCGSDVRRRAGRRVRHGARDCVEVPRDLPRRGRATDGDRSRPRTVAALDSLFPVWAIASDDATLPAVLEAVARARDAGATVVASGTAAERVPGADYVLPVPRPPTHLLAPLLSVVPGQLFAWALARARASTPTQPRGLSKVTLAR